MRTELSIGMALAAIALVSPRPASAQDSTLACRVAPCAVIFEWGNGNTPPDPDRRYGAPSDMEAMFIARLGELGMTTVRGGDATSTITMRLTPLNRAICESMSGTNTDYSCHTVDRATITLRHDNPSAKQLPRIEVIARCSDPKVSIGFAQFGRYAAELLAYTAAGSKGQRPSAKC